jgi:nitrogen fixation protein FixH
VVLYAYRPSDHEADFSVAMDRSQVGMYNADVSFTLPGIWDLIVEAKQGDDKVVTTKRISVLP